VGRLVVTEILVFDLYGTLVDPLALAPDLDALGIDGGEVAGLWRLKQLEYSFRLTVMGEYQDFRHVTSRALDFALASAGVNVPGDRLHQILGRYDQLPAFPDAEPALQSLADLGYELAVLSNGTPGMIRSCLASSHLDGYLSRQLSVDPVGAFKPAAAVYRHAAERLGRPAAQIRLVSANAFDSAGAAAAGMRTVWVNRSAALFDTIGQRPDITVPALDQLPEALAGRPASD
jgi:2-haloacid dehalogenase